MYALQAVVDLIDRMSGPIMTPIRRMQELEHVVGLADAAMDRLQQGAQIVAVGAALTAPLALATNEAIKFESAYSKVIKTVEFTPDFGPKKLEQELISLSNQIPIAATGFAAIAEEAGSAGIATKELTRFAGDAAQLGVAFDMTANEAGSALGRLRINFQATQDEAMNIADATNHLSNVMASKAPDILEVLGRVGSTATLINMTGTELAALASTMLSTGSAPEVVSTGLNAMMRKMGAASSEGKRFQNTLENMGMTAKGLETAVRDDAQGAILDLLGAVNNSINPLATLTDLFGAEYADDIAKLSGNMGALEGAFKQVNDTAAYAGSVQKEYAVQSATTAHQLQLLRNRVQNVGIILGSVFLPPLNAVLGVVGDVLVKMQEWAQANPLLSQTIMGVIAIAGIALVTFGLVTMSLGAIGFASAQAKIGLVVMKDVMGGVANVAKGMVQRLFAARFGVQALALASAEGVAPLTMLRMSLGNLGGAFRALTVAMLANPIVLIAAGVIALGSAFIWAWNHVETFKQNVIAIVQPLLLSFTDLKNSFMGLLNQFGGAGDWIASQFANLGGVFDAIGYGIGFVLGFIMTAVVIVFTRIATVVTQALGGVIDIISGVVETVIGLFTGDMDKARAGVVKIFNGIVKIVSAPLRLLGIQWFKVKDSLTAAWEWMNQWMSKAWRWGSDLMVGIAKNIANSAGQVWQAITRVFDGAPQPTIRPTIVNTPNPPRSPATPSAALPNTVPNPPRLPATPSPALPNTVPSPVSNTPRVVPSVPRTQENTTVTMPMTPLETSINVNPNFKSLEPTIPNLNPLEQSIKYNVPKPPVTTNLNPLERTLSYKTLNTPTTPNLNPLEQSIKYNTLDIPTPPRIPEFKGIQNTTKLNTLPTIPNVSKQLAARPPRITAPSPSAPPEDRSSNQRPSVTINNEFKFVVPNSVKTATEFIYELERQLPGAMEKILERWAKELGYREE